MITQQAGSAEYSWSTYSVETGLFRPIQDYERGLCLSQTISDDIRRKLIDKHVPVQKTSPFQIVDRGNATHQESSLQNSESLHDNTQGPERSLLWR